MRGFRAVLASATILLVCSSDLVESTSQNKLTGVNGAYSVKSTGGTSDIKRSLRRYESEDDEERKIPDKLTGLIKVKQKPIQRTIHIDNIPEIREAHAVLDPNKADELLEAGFLGWLGKADLDKVLHSNNFNDKIAVFAKWRNDRRSPKLVTELISKNKAIEHKYKHVYVMYDGYMKSMEKKNVITGLKRKRGEI
ncbi:RxLR effector protein [Phytophthora megakarya]|uniref:RxLR effector protein n=1 Tax=Phytophthora megakarya TaxID=4795 RepID=A0A225VVU8_9STRA|nr:RxLR effector protein [Phytophthora megakarya]